MNNSKYTDSEFQDAVQVVLERLPIVTSRAIADHVGCSRELARQYLVSEFKKGKFAREQVGGGAKIYYPNQKESEIASEQASEEDTIASAQTSTGSEISPAQNSSENEEQILFFPGQREIAVHSPRSNTQRILSQTGHLIDSTAEGYLYKISEEDIWNSPYDQFEDLRDDLKTVIGESRWDGGFESRIRDDWERAHQFRLVTERRDSGQEYTVLEAESSEVFEDVAKRKMCPDEW